MITRHTDKHLGLNDSSLLFAVLGKAESLISTAARQKFEIDHWAWPLTLTLKQGNKWGQNTIFGNWPWPTTLTYNPSLAKVKVDADTKNQGQRSNGSAVRELTDGRYQVHNLPASRSIKMKQLEVDVSPPTFPLMAYIYWRQDSTLMKDVFCPVTFCLVLIFCHRRTVRKRCMSPPRITTGGFKSGPCIPDVHLSMQRKS